MIFAAIVACIGIQYWFFELLEPNSGRAIVTIVAKSMLNTMYSICIFLIGTIYVGYWKSVSKTSVVVWILAIGLIPYASLFWQVNYEPWIVPKSSALLLLVVSTIVLLAYIQVAVTARAVEWYREHATLEKTLLFTRFPPERRSDMVGFDVVFLLILVLPLIIN